MPVPVLTSVAPVPPPPPPSAMTPVTLVERLLPPTVSSPGAEVEGAAAGERAGAELVVAGRAGREAEIRVAQDAIGDGGVARRAGVEKYARRRCW